LPGLNQTRTQLDVEVNRLVSEDAQALLGRVEDGRDAELTELAVAGGRVTLTGERACGEEGRAGGAVEARLTGAVVERGNAGLGRLAVGAFVFSGAGALVTTRGRYVGTSGTVAAGRGGATGRTEIAELSNEAGVAQARGVEAVRGRFADALTATDEVTERELGLALRAVVGREAAAGVAGLVQRGTGSAVLAGLA